MINVRRAKIEDIPMIMQFLDDHWLKGYALAHNRELFDWQFVKDGKVNIWIGVDDEEGKMYAMVGAVVYNSSDNPDISGMLWISTKSSNPFLAMDVTDLQENDLSPSYSYSIGLLPDAVKFHKRMHHEVAKMDHYYRLAKKEEYHIADVSYPIIPNVNETGYMMTRINGMDDVKKTIDEDIFLTGSPKKDYEYIEWRYFKHPVFTYDVWKILSPDESQKGILVTREEKANGSKSCKIVDFYGNKNILLDVSVCLDKLMTEKNYEFIDVYSYGIPASIYGKAGFLNVENSGNIIPNFFQPYTCTNSDIYILKPEAPNTVLFRGDADQDKPRFA